MKFIGPCELWIVNFFEYVKTQTHPFWFRRSTKNKKIHSKNVLEHLEENTLGGL